MEFTQNDWGQRDIINKIKILTKLGTDTIHAVISTKYQKYPSTERVHPWGGETDNRKTTAEREGWEVFLPLTGGGHEGGGAHRRPFTYAKIGRA